MSLFPPATLARNLTLLSITVSLAMLVLGGAVLLDLRREAWVSAERQSDNLASALSRDIARNIQLYDLSIRGAIDAVTNPAVLRLDPELRQIAIFDRASMAEYLGAMLIADASGNVVYVSHAPNVKSVNIGDRDYFRVQRERPDAGLFISRPVMGRIMHAEMIGLSRRISNPDGSFGGVVEGAIRIAYFRDLFATLDLGRKGSVTLFRDDGHVIMRRPLRPGDLDRDLSQSAGLRTFVAKRRTHLVAKAASDGTERLYTVQYVEGFPLILSIGMALEDIYADWWRKATTIGAVMLVLWSASMGLCLLFRRELVRRMAAENALIDAAKRLSVAAMTDELTCVPNRRAFDEALGRDWRRAIRDQMAIALLLLDVDCFKTFNDRYGHQAGDAALRAVASCTAGSVRRPGDLAARYGGEEFVALLPDTDLAGALGMAESIRKRVADLMVPHEDGPAGYLTISVGVAVARPGIGDSAAAMVGEADEALYRAKREGRNRVIASPASRATARLSATAGFAIG